MGAPVPEMDPVENASAEALLDSLKTIDPAERRKHASVFNYWLSIRGNRPFPPIRDLDPLEISDAGPWSLLLEMIGGGEDAVIRHFGQAIKGDGEVERIADAPGPSLLSCIHAKLPLVAACREAMAFEDSFKTADGRRRCWVTLLPFSANGNWIDYVYGYVSLEGAETVEKAPEPVAGESEPEPVAEEVEPEPVANEAEPEAAAEDTDLAEPAEPEAEPFQVPLGRLDGEEEAAESEPEPEPEYEPEYEPEEGRKPGFTAKFMESLASVGSLYAKGAPAEPVAPDAELAEEAAPEPADPQETIEPETAVIEEPAPVPEPAPVTASQEEGSLHSKLTEVRALAEEAREAQVRSNLALYDGLSAAYDFALDAEVEPEEYLKLVEAQGMKIQLRSPMKPVVRLAFDGMCDEPTIGKLEAVLAWALKQDLPRGSLREKIESEGGIGQILREQAA